MSRPSSSPFILPRPYAAIGLVVLLVVFPTICESKVYHTMRKTTAPTTTTAITTRMSRSKLAFSIRLRPSRDTNHQRNFMSMVSSTSTSTSTTTSSSSNTKGTFRLKPKSELQPKPQTMTFTATKQVKTEQISIPPATSTESLIALLNEFFSNESNRNLLFPNNNAESLNDAAHGHDNNNNAHGKLQQQPKQQLISHEFVEKWKTEAQLGGGEGPSVVQVHDNGNGNNNSSSSSSSSSSSQHRYPLYELVSEPTRNEKYKNHLERQAIFKIDAELRMPGLQIISESTIGMKLLLPLPLPPSPSPSSESEIFGFQKEVVFPEYQFTLLESNLKPKGRAPVVWLFNKLTKYRDSTSSFTKVRVEKIVASNQNQNQNQNNVHIDDDDEEEEEKSNDEKNHPLHIVFVTDAKMETRMHLPSKLLKVLPNVNIAKFESQGSASVQRLLEKELGPALSGFGQAFCTFIKR